MKRKINHIFWLAAFMFLGSCVSDFHADIPFSDENILVVEGDIIDNSEVDIIISRTFGLDASALPEDYNKINATVYLTGSDGYKSPMATYMGNGIHRISIGELLDDVSYSIEIEYEGEKYSSEPEKPLITPEIDKLNWKQPSEGADVSIHISTHNDLPGFSYYMWDYIEDWEFNSRYDVYDFYNPDTKSMEHYDLAPVYHCWRNRRGKEILIGSTESYTENKIQNQELRKYESGDERFNFLYSIRLKQIALTKKAYEYYQNKLKLNEDMGGLFSPQPSELSGNIKCTSDKSRKVIGYINILKNVAETQLYIKGSEISKKYFVWCPALSKDEVMEILSKSEIPMTLHEFYNTGYWPLDGTMLGEANAWAQAECIDCTRVGGTKNKPDWWPNDHQ